VSEGSIGHNAAEIGWRIYRLRSHHAQKGREAENNKDSVENSIRERFKRGKSRGESQAGIN